MQKVKGVKVTRKVKTVKRKFYIKKKTHTFTIIAMNCVQEQLINIAIIKRTSLERGLLATKFRKPPKNVNFKIENCKT